MFKKGDKIVDKSNNKICTFVRYFYGNSYYLLIYGEDINFHISSDFIKLSEYRKQKFLNINKC